MRRPTLAIGDETVTQYLHAQMKHLDAQMEYLHDQLELTLTHMRYQHFSDWLSAAWKVLLVIVGRA